MLCDLLDEKGLLGKVKSKIDYYIGFTSEKYNENVLEIATELRNKGFTVYTDTKKNKMKKILSNADEKNSKKAIILDEREMTDSSAILKDMNTKESNIIKINEIKNACL